MVLNGSLAPLTNNPGIALAGAFALLIGYLFFAESGASSRAEQVDSVGDRLEGLVGGLLSGTRALLLSLLAIVAVVANEFMALVGDVSSAIEAGPLLLGHAAYGAATMFGLSFGIDRSTFAVAFIGITAIALVWGAASAASRRRSFG